jgi:uncharacterized protein YneF (UPF0154 family)
MKNTSKALAIATTICFALGIGFFLYFHFLEYQARQKLPPEMRTPEAIQALYDGSVCLGSDISATLSLTLFFAIGIFIAVLREIHKTFSKKRQELK